MSSQFSYGQSGRGTKASSSEIDLTIPPDSYLDENLLDDHTAESLGLGSTQTRSPSSQTSLPSAASRPFPHSMRMSNSRYEPPQPPSSPRSFRQPQPAPLPQFPPRPESPQTSYRLVIALDYGTTFTGVAYATPKSGSAELADVETVDYWGPSMGNHAKIPSVYSYSRAIHGEEMWGANIGDDAITMVNTKLELDVQENKLDELELILQLLEGTGNLSLDNVKTAGGYPAYTWKSPEEIVTDYLTRIFEYLDKAIGHFSSQLRARIPVDIVITMPVRWSYRAKESTFKAMQRAGFNQKTFPQLQQIIMVTEPEAAAIYTARHLKDDKSEEFLQIGECFVLCDAGGGTVDVISYQVEKLEPNLELKAVSIPTNAKCGSAYINLEFKRCLKFYIGDENYSKIDPTNSSRKIGSHTTEGPAMRQLIESFEALKQGFSSSSNVMKLDLPHPLDGLNIPGIVREGELIISPDVMRYLFERSVERIIELIESQVTQVEAKQRRVKNVFLVGGFGESPYLREELEESLKRRGITIRRPDMRKAWTAVVKGAVLYGVEKANNTHLVLMTPSPRSYGLVIDENYSGHLFDPRDRYVDSLTSALKSAKQITWMIRKGDLVLSDEKKVVEKEIVLTFPEEQSQVINLPVYTYRFDKNDDNPPERWETGRHELDEICVLKCDLRQIPDSEFDRRKNYSTGQKYSVVGLVCRMRLSTRSLEVDLHLNMNKVARAEIPVPGTGNSGFPYG